MHTTREPPATASHSSQAKDSAGDLVDRDVRFADPSCFGLPDQDVSDKGLGHWVSGRETRVIRGPVVPHVPRHMVTAGGAMNLTNGREGPLCKFSPRECVDQEFGVRAQDSVNLTFIEEEDGVPSVALTRRKWSPGTMAL